MFTDPNGNAMVINSYAWEPHCEPGNTTLIVMGHSGGQGSSGGTGGSSSVMRPVNGPSDPNPPALITEPCYIKSKRLANPLLE